MKKGFKRLATILASAVLAASMSLTAFACVRFTGYVSGKDVGYNKAPIINEDDLSMKYDLKCDTLYLNEISYSNITPSQQTVGNKLLKINFHSTFKMFSKYYKTLRFVDSKYKPLCSSYPIMAQHTSKNQVTISVADNCLFHYNTKFISENSHIKADGSVEVDYKFRINEHHILYGFEVKLVKADNKNCAYTAIVKNMNHYGDDLYDDSENVYTDFTAHFEYKNLPKGKYYITINGEKVKTINK